MAKVDKIISSPVMTTRYHHETTNGYEEKIEGTSVTEPTCVKVEKRSQQCSTDSSPVGNGCDSEASDSEASASAKSAPRNDFFHLKLPFPWKLHQLLEDADREGHQQIVSWTLEGRAFRVHRQEEFAAKIMRLYFRQTKYKSFTRQLYIYGFVRISHGVNRGAFFHPQFLRSNKSLSLSMIRNSKHGTPGSDTIDPMAIAKMMSQNQVAHYDSERESPLVASLSTLLSLDGSNAKIPSFDGMTQIDTVGKGSLLRKPDQVVSQRFTNLTSSIESAELVGTARSFVHSSGSLTSTLQPVFDSESSTRKFQVRNTLPNSTSSRYSALPNQLEQSNGMDNVTTQRGHSSTTRNEFAHSLTNPASGEYSSDPGQFRAAKNTGARTQQRLSFLDPIQNVPERKDWFDCLIEMVLPTDNNNNNNVASTFDDGSEGSGIAVDFEPRRIEDMVRCEQCLEHDSRTEKCPHIN